MPPISSGGQIDFTHVTGISYVNDHPSWRNYEETDLNFLRALGYPLAVDAALNGRVPVRDFRLSGTNAELTCQTRSTHYYRIKTSRDLIHWNVLPKGVRVTDSSMKLTLPADPAEEPMQFYQVVEVPQ